MLKKFLQFSLILVTTHVLNAQAPLAGSYNGLFYVKLSGLVNEAESGFGPALINIDAAGVVSQSGGGLTGQVDASGKITWQTPNAFYFETGSIVNGTITAIGSRSDAGLTTTFRLEARKGGSGFGAGGGFTENLRLVEPRPHKDELEGAAFGSGTYVLVGRGGLILRSGNARDWLHIPTGRGHDLQDVAFGSGTFVAVGNLGIILYSKDAGLTWSAATSGSVFDFYGVSFGNGRFVAAGRAGVAHSTDGVQWTSVGIPGSTANQWDMVDFLNGRFVVFGGRSGVGMHNEITTSVDGVTWNSAQSYNAGTFTGAAQAAYGNGVFVIPANAGIYTFSSEDGSGATMTPSNLGLSGIVFDAASSQFVATRSANQGEVYVSSNGKAWTRVATAANTRSDELFFQNGIYLSPGFTLADSTNFTHWNSLNKVAPTTIDTEVTGAYFDQAYAPNGVIRGLTAVGAIGTAPTIFDGVRTPQNQLILVGAGGLILNKGQFVSQDQRLTSGTTVDLLGVGSAPPGGNATVVVGSNGTLLTSTDSFTWTARTSGTTATLREAAGGASQLVVVGDSGTILTAVQTSLGQWSQVNSGTTEHLRSVAFAGYFANNRPAANFAAVGDNGTVLTSPDGLTWTKRDSGVSAHLISVVIGTDGRHVALARDGSILQSTNSGVAWKDAGVKLNDVPVALTLSGGAPSTIYVLGKRSQYLVGTSTTWQTKEYPAPPAGNGIGQVAHGNGLFVGVGGNSTAVSADGETWTNYYNPAGYTAISYGAGRFIAVGGGVAGLSLDGIHWQTQLLRAGFLFSKPAYGQGLFVTISGIGDAYTSTDGVSWTARPTGGTAPIESLAYGGGQFIGVGTRQISSTNGIIWQSTGVGSGNTFHDITYANGLWVRVGEASRGGLIQTSINGQTWTTRFNPGGNTQLYAVNWLDGLWVAVGAPLANDRGAGVYTSTNGTNWVTSEAHLDGALQSIAAGNGAAILVGSGAVFKVEYADARSPVITAAPAPQTVAAGGTLSASVAVSGAAPLEFQWLKDGAPLADGARVGGATAATLIIQSVLPSDQGLYSVIVYNRAGSRVSQPALISVGGNGGGGAMSFAAWRARFALPSGKDGPGDDADLDRLLNVVEFAFGSDPTLANSGEFPHATSAEINGVVYPAISYLRDTAISGVSIVVEAAGDVSFTTLVELTEITPRQDLGNGLQRVTMRTVLPAQPSTKVFFRSRVIQN